MSNHLSNLLFKLLKAYDVSIMQSGILLAVQDVTDAGEPNYREERIKEVKKSIFKYSFAGVFIALLAVLAYFSWENNG